MSFNNLCLGLIDSLLSKSGVLRYVKALSKKEDNVNFWSFNILTEDDFNINNFNQNDMKDTLYLLMLKNLHLRRANEIKNRISSNNKLNYDKFISKLDSLLENSPLIKNILIFKYIYDYITNTEFSFKIYDHDLRYDIEDLFENETIYQEFLTAKSNIRKLLDKIDDFEDVIDKDFKYIGEKLLEQIDNKITGGNSTYNNERELNEATKIILGIL